VPFENLKDRQGLKTFAKADHVSTATDKKQEYRKNMITISAYASIASLYTVAAKKIITRQLIIPLFRFFFYF
jgi:hypothetical protein